MMRQLSARLHAALALVWLAGCAGASHPALPPSSNAAALTASPESGAGKITHVIYIIQENRSFNNLFYGYPGAYTVPSGKVSNGRTVALKPVSLAYQYIIDHSSAAMFAACNGKGRLPGTRCRMNGFDKEYVDLGPPGVKYAEYVYVPHRESKPYFDMAREWVLADRMFQSQLDESFVAHQYAIAAQAQASVDLPFGAWGCVPGASELVQTLTKQRTYGPAESPCFDYQTLGDELDRAGLTWRFYSSWYHTKSSGFGAVWSSYQAVKHI
ncbi:MAG: hypothetical protein JO324_01665, partial [Candidatus Eremiobacteraeota bacterium]|nr:hypothetical protein [Candidatus Eremiobacteraeota bacterium]